MKVEVKLLLEFKKELLDPDARQHALYRLYLNLLLEN